VDTPYSIIMAVTALVAQRGGAGNCASFALYVNRVRADLWHPFVSSLALPTRDAPRPSNLGLNAPRRRVFQAFHAQQ
jgi:hypothetical protein